MCDNLPQTALQPSEEVECASDASITSTSQAAIRGVIGVRSTIHKSSKLQRLSNRTLTSVKRVVADKPTWKLVSEHWAVIDCHASGCDGTYSKWWNLHLIPYINKLKGKISLHKEYIQDLEEENEDLQDQVEKLEDKKHMYKTLYEDAKECANHCTCDPSADDLNDLQD